MYFILQEQHGSFYTEPLANDEFSSLQAAEKKISSYKGTRPEE